MKYSIQGIASKRIAIPKGWNKCYDLSKSAILSALEKWVGLIAPRTDLITGACDQPESFS